MIPHNLRLVEKLLLAEHEAPSRCKYRYTFRCNRCGFTMMTLGNTTPSASYNGDCDDFVIRQIMLG